MIKFRIRVRTDRGVFESVPLEALACDSVKEVAASYSDVIEKLDNIYFEMEGGDYVLFPKTILQNSILMFLPAE